MKPSAGIRENSLSNGITTSSSTPRPSITSRLTSNGMISFGAASGWITVSGCGSKVSTVSASSITAWWPLWTPSKTPIATCRSRGFASGSLCDLDRHTRTTSGRRFSPSRRATAISWPSCSRVRTAGSRSEPARLAARPGDARATHAARPRRSLELALREERHRAPPTEISAVAIRHLERADRGPAQRLAVGVLQGLDQGADVGARRALDLEAGALVVALDQLGPMDGHRPGRGLHRPPRGGPFGRAARPRP